jgi:hypothetical protein
MSTGPVMDPATLEELRRLARSRPRAGRESVAKASAIRTLERLAREGRRQPIPPMPEGWYPHWDVHDAHRNVTQRLTPQRAKELLGGKMPNEFTLMDATAKLVAGNVQRRLLGVVLLGVGLAVQMVGNLAAL